MKDLTLLKFMYMFRGLICFFNSSSKLIMMNNLPTIHHSLNSKEIQNTTELTLTVLYRLKVNLKEWYTCYLVISQGKYFECKKQF